VTGRHPADGLVMVIVSVKALPGREASSFLMAHQHTKEDHFVPQTSRAITATYE